MFGRADCEDAVLPDRAVVQAVRYVTSESGMYATAVAGGGVRYGGAGRTSDRS